MFFLTLLCPVAFIGLQGYDVLRRISDVISQPNRKTLEQLSG